ncbi:phytanoyl-CoA dioxygenase family protein [Sphingopyxis sp.]|uniref:phytanoyl-CoA dioxygenase family protein n=1 Tax=Sphingopyxis sp. TaxID=1908224 RepID=UPI002FCC019E
MRVMPLIKAAVNSAVDRRYRYYYGHRNVATFGEREKLARAHLARLPSREAEQSDVAKALAADGIAMLPRLWDDEQLTEIRGYFESHTCADPYRPNLGQFIAPANAPPETHVGYFSNEQVAHAPHCLRLANDPLILDAVAAVLGAKPTISYMAAWWSMPGRGKPEHGEMFHRDVDDLRFAKLFVYLTDVTSTSGPHMFVKGSHRSEKLSERIRYSDDSVEENFPKQDILKLTGSAGTMFLENTFGLHRGVPPSDEPRLIFQVLYSFEEYIGGPRRPVRTVQSEFEGTTLDPYINRAYCRVA